MIVRIGGLSMDITDAWRSQLALEQAVAAAADCFDEIAERLEGGHPSPGSRPSSTQPVASSPVPAAGHATSATT